MIQEIRDELFQVSKKVDREQLFELCPIYFFTYREKNDRHIQMPEHEGIRREALKCQRRLQ